LYSIGLLFVIPAILFDPTTRNAGGILGGLLFAPFATLAFAPLVLPIALWAGGRAAPQHLVLRLLLVRNRAAPWKYVRFLDEASDRLLLRKVGGGYVFVHRLLLDYFADLNTNGAMGTAQQVSHPTAAH
jgi:hypothetical protein